MPKYDHKAGIYAIEHVASGRLYVGSSADLPRRWVGHKHSLNRGVHVSVDMQHAWTEDGADAFQFHILEVCEPDRALLADYEQGYIDAFAPVFNRRLRATRSSLGARYPRPGITECPYGHAYDEANTGYSKLNQRYCRECARLRVTAKYVPLTVRRNGPTCKRGHEWTPENTITIKNGTRQCRACRAQRREARNERVRARYESDAEFRERNHTYYATHREEILAQDKIKRDQQRAARPEPQPSTTCTKGHPWVIGATGHRFCSMCRAGWRAARVAAETPEQHAARLARRQELERAGYRDANQRAYARRKSRASTSRIS